MSFANPWALAGLAMIAVPIGVHLLARHRGPRTRFPTLRFLMSDRLVSLRRYRLTDLLLMAIRIAIVATAAFALAGPRLSLPATARNATPARVIVVDSSASMTRASSDGRSAIDRARARAKLIRGETDRGTIVEAVNLDTAIDGAVAWLATAAPPRELVIVSDLQQGALSASSFRAVPDDIGIRIEPIDAVSSSTATLPVVWRNDTNNKLRQMTPQIVFSKDRSTITWIAGPDLSADPLRTFDLDPMVGFVASPAESTRAVAALRIVMGEGSLSGSRDKPVAMIFPGAAKHGEIWDHAGAMDQPWMLDVASAIAGDAQITAAAKDLVATRPVDLRAQLTPLVIGATGAPVVIAASGQIGDAHRLLLFVESDPASLMSALTLADVLRETGTVTPPSELEPRLIDASQWRTWQRPPKPAATNANRPSNPIGRWFWALTLVWLLVETWMRRQARPDEMTEVAHGRVA